MNRVPCFVSVPLFFDALLDEADDVALRFNDCKQLVPSFVSPCEMGTPAGHLDSFSNRTFSHNATLTLGCHVPRDR